MRCSTRFAADRGPRSLRLRHHQPFPDMSTTVRPNASVSIDSDAESTADERRQRTRLRELCDEVLASFRVASGNDMLSADDRREARTLLDRFAPRAGKRERSR
jgi:hypothetical protein